MEEMDSIFGSVGVAQADSERMREITKEIGLDDLVRHHSVSEPTFLEEKHGVAEHKNITTDGHSE